MLTELQLKALKSVLHKHIDKQLLKYNEENKKVLDKQIVIAGDSIAELVPKEYLEKYQLLNRGVAGIDSISFLSVFEQVVLPLNPKILFITIGSNDLVLLKATPNEAANNVIKLLETIQQQLPQTIIYYLSATPVLNEDADKYKAFYVAGRTNEQIDLMNRLIRSSVVNFIDISLLLKDGNDYLEYWYTTDGIHLNPKGYKEYFSELDEIINKNLRT